MYVGNSPLHVKIFPLQFGSWSDLKVWYTFKCLHECTTFVCPNLDYSSFQETKAPFCKKPKLLRHLTKACKSMAASRVMYSYSGNANSNNSNIGATYRHDAARRWPPSYTRTTPPLRPTGSVTGGVQSGGTSKSFPSKSLLPSKISPGELASMLVTYSLQVTLKID